MSLLLIAICLTVLQAFVSIRVAYPRRETEVASFELFLHVQRACGLQGRVSTDPTHPPAPPDPWRFFALMFALEERHKIGGYPEAMFSSICSNAIMIHMWFYNLVLKFNGFDYDQWIKLNFKPVVPPLFSSKVSFDKDNPQKPRQHKGSKLSYKLRLCLAAFAMLNAGLSEGELFSLKSDLQLRKQLRCFRSKINGSLDVSRIPDGNIKIALRSRIQEISTAFNDLTREAPNAFKCKCN